MANLGARSPSQQQRAQRQEVYTRIASKDPVRLVSEDGSHRVVPYGEALKAAKRSGGDLIMVARHAKPPVLKLGDAQKALFAQRQQEKEMRRRQLEAKRALSVKEVRVSASIAENDLERQLNLARGFLEKGYKVRVNVMHARRPGARYAAYAKLEAIRERVQPWAVLEQEQRRRGGGPPSMLLSPPAPTGR